MSGVCTPGSMAGCAHAHQSPSRLPTIQAKLVERGPANRPVQYQLLDHDTGERSSVRWDGVATWLEEVAHAGAWRYGFTIRDEQPHVAFIVFMRSRESRSQSTVAPASKRCVGAHGVCG
jgi:hypothetical protein